MDEKEKKFRALLKKAEEEYFAIPDKANNDKKKITAFLEEMKTVDLLGDDLTWMN